MPSILPNSRINCFCEPGPKTGLFTDYCQILMPGQEIILCEKNIKKPKLPYYISFVADGQVPVIVLALEKYVDDTNGAGRKTDFLIAGQNPCKQKDQVFVVFLELLDELSHENNWYTKKVLQNGDTEEEGKLPQCKSAIKLLCKNGDDYQRLHSDFVIQQFLGHLNHSFTSHRVAAAVVPAIASKSRGLGTDLGSFGGKPIRIVALPNSLFKKPITWMLLLKALGLVNC